MSPPRNSSSNPKRAPSCRKTGVLFGSLSRKEPPDAALPPGDSFSLTLAASEPRSRHNGSVTPIPGRLFDERPQRALDVCDQPGTKVPRRGHLPANAAEPQRPPHIRVRWNRGSRGSCGVTGDRATAERGTGEFAAVAALLKRGRARGLNRS